VTIGITRYLYTYILMCAIYDEGRIKNLPTPSKEAIMIPQAGAILAMRGMIPAKNADGPSVLKIRKRIGKVLGEMLWVDEDIIRACCRVLRTSNGDVISAAEVPLIAPLTKATHAPS